MSTNYVNAMLAINMAAAGAISGKDGTRIEEDELKNFRGVSALYAAYKAVFGERMSQLLLFGATIRTEIFEDNRLISYSIEEFVDDVEKAKADLIRNGNLPEPLMHSAAIRKPHLVAFLKAVMQAYSKFNLVSEIHFNGKMYRPPILTPGDFTEPGPNDLRLSGEWRIVSLHRNDEEGHGFSLTSNKLTVLLPLNEARWIWSAIHDVLEQPTLFIGTLVRESKLHPWMPDARVKLEIRGNYPLF